ncbi:MAG: hypothetical protein Rubg2KO_16100 [Rubricoccaceae bacterium]
MRALFLAACLMAPTAVAQSEATYSVTFTSSWSATTHPDGFPGNPHFSGLVGATHDANTTLWEVGGKASPGIELMAETGSKSTLMAETDALVDAGVETTLSGGGIGTSPGTVALTFSATESHAYVSLVSMLAPSPDWFVGVNGLALRDGDGWMQETTVPLFVYDSGTDSGPNYTSANDDTDPAEDIFRIEESPFMVNNALVQVGTFTFALQSVTANESSPGVLELTTPAPNPASSYTSLTVSRPDASPMTVEVFDALGRLVGAPAVPESAGQHDIRIATARYAPGMYHVRVTTASETATRRFVVQR